MTPPMVFFSYSTCADTDSTVTTSLLWPICIRISTVVVPPTWTSAPRMVVRKPVTLAFTSYSPAWREGATNEPSEPDRIVREAPVALLVMTTSASGTTAPDSSITTPEMVPVGACPTIGTAASKQSAAANRQRCRILFIDPSFVLCYCVGGWSGTAERADVGHRRRRR